MSNGQDPGGFNPRTGYPNDLLDSFKPTTPMPAVDLSSPNQGANFNGQTGEPVNKTGLDTPTVPNLPPVYDPTSTNSGEPHGDSPDGEPTQPLPPAE